MAKLIFGCGYLGRRVADTWIESGETVYAVTRTERRADELRSSGIQPIVLDITQPHDQLTIPNVSTVLFAVGFDRTTGKSIRDVYVGGLSRALNLLRAERLIYISSTGVYGQTDADWVDESSF